MTAEKISEKEIEHFRKLISDGVLKREKGETIQTVENEFKMYSVKEVAAMLDITDRTVWRMIEDGSLRSVKLRRVVRILHDDLKAFLMRDATPTDIGNAVEKLEPETKVLLVDRP